METALPNGVRVTEMIMQLEADRERHAQAMASIDEVLQQIGQIIDSLQHPGQALELSFGAGIEAFKIGPRRRSFEQTGEQSVLKFVRERGNPTTAEINAHWRSEGRRGLVNVTLLQLIKRGRLRREIDPSVRGSRYLIANDVAANATDSAVA